MAEQFYTILTSVGKAKIANASALGQKINFTHFALGDGGGSYYNPAESQVGLKNEVWRGRIGNVVIDEGNPNWIVLENIIPSSIGGFMIREAGVFDDEGNLIAIGKYPETYKPVVENGSAKDLIIKMILEVSNTSAVTLKIDPTIILATKKDIDTLSNRIKKNEDDIKELKQGSTIMEDLQTENKTLAGAINEALDKADQAFQSGVDRKQQAIVNINSKGVNVDDSMSFSKVLDGILDIETDKTGDATATAADILAPKDAYVKGQKIKGTIPSKGAATITPTTSPQTIAAGQYLSGAQTIAGVSVPVANVLAGVTIAGADGTMPNRGALNQTITSNNGQVDIAAGYYTGGVIKAIFANLVAANIKAGVNIGGVIGNYSPVPIFSTFSIPLSTRFSSTPTGMTQTIPLPTPPPSSFVVAVCVFVGYPPNGEFIILGGGAPTSGVPVSGGATSDWSGSISIVGNSLSVYAKSGGTGFQYIQVGGNTDKARSFVIYGVI